MSNRITRRRFMITAGAAASAVVGSSIFNVDSVMAAPYIRRNLGGMAASDPVLVSYRKAIKAMKLLPASNPLSWAYQAAIHGTNSFWLTYSMEYLRARNSLLLVLAPHVSLLV